MNLDERNMVYLNGKAMQIARWPNDKDGDLYTLDGIQLDTKGTMSSLSYSGIPSLDWSDAFVFYLGAHSGCSWQSKVNSINGGVVTFDVLPDKWPASPHNPSKRENGHFGNFYLFNSFDALDTLNEWYYKSGKLYCYLSREQVKDANIEVAVRTATATLNRNHIVLDGLNFFGAGIYITGNHVKVTNCQVKYGSSKIYVPRKDNGEVDSGDGDAAISISKGDNVVIENCVLEYGTTNGIKVNGNSDNTLIKNNVVMYFDFIGIHATPILVSGNNSEVIGNTIAHTGRDGSKLTGDNSRFAYNDVSHGLRMCSDGGLFYVTGQSTDRNIELDHNWFHDAYSPDYSGLKANGIYLDNNSGGYDVHHNVVWKTQWRGLQMNWTAVYNNIYHNTFWDVGQDQEVFGCWIPCKTKDNSGNCLERHDVRDNKLYNNLSDVRTWWLSKDGNYTEDETLDNDFKDNYQLGVSPFVDYASQDFMLTSGVSVIDQGRVISGINDGFQGSAPDIGAYEYGGDNWKAGSSIVYEELYWKDELAITKIDTIDHPTQIDHEIRTGQINVYPNPFSIGQKLQIDAIEPIQHVSILDIHGRLISNIEVSNGSSSFDLDMNSLNSQTMVILVVGTSSVTEIKRLILN